MSKFWGYIQNSEFSVGCTGQTVYVFDCAGNELATFKDIIYAYTPLFCPGKNIFIVKSTNGMLAVYSLDSLKLLKKFPYSKVRFSQDDGCCFSGDGKYFYNIERIGDSLQTRLTIYDTENFEVIRRLLDDDPSLVLSEIEFDKTRNVFFVIGFIRNKGDQLNTNFVSELIDDKLPNKIEIPEKEYHFITGYKKLEMYGFTQKARTWSSLSYLGYDVKNIEPNQLKISDYCHS